MQKNWGGYNYWESAEKAFPTSLEALRKTIKDAASQRKKIRAAGALHSFNTLAATNELQIYMRHLNQVHWIDRESLRVKVEGGITIKALLNTLAKAGLTLPNQGYTVDQTIAGAIATATHGSGKTGTLSSFVEELEIVDAKGSVHTLTPYLDAHLFSAAVVNLGCLGIVYTLVLRCIPLVHLQLTRERTSFVDALQELSEKVGQLDYFQFSLNPYSEDTIAWYYKITHLPKHGGSTYLLKWGSIKFLSYLTFDLKLAPSAFLPVLLKSYFAISPLKSCVDESIRLLSPADEAHYIEEEIAIPFEFLEEGLTLTREIIKRHKNHRTVAIILIRFSEPDRYGYLSPALHRQTAYISLVAIPRKGYRELFQEFEEALLPLGGKPHWGKVHFLTRDAVKKLYGENYKLFLSAKNHFDPDYIFTNTYIDKLFG